MSDAITLPDGTPVKLGCRQPGELRFGAVPAWEDANPVLSEDECQDHDDLAGFTPSIGQQNFNNCTNAALASLAEAAFRAAGEPETPPLSWSFLYAHHNGRRDQGAYCRDLADDLRKRGLPRADLWPENKIYLPRGGVPREVAEDAASRTALEIYQCLGWADVRSALARRFFVYHGFVLGRAFFNTGRDGRVPSFDGSFANGHAMWSRGLTRRFGDLRTVCVNSWGRSFGENGIGYIDASYFWGQRGNTVNLDCYAVRAVRRRDPLPPAA